MVDPDTVSDEPEALTGPDVADTVKFLRRFAELMSNGDAVAYLNQAAYWLETLTLRVVTAFDEDQLLQRKYDAVITQNEQLETECDALRNDLDGHAAVASAILAERDSLKSSLETEQSTHGELADTLARERAEFETRTEAHRTTLAELHGSVERASADRDSANNERIEAAEQKHAADIEQTRGDFERQREELQSKLSVQEALVVQAGLECETLRAELAALQARPAVVEPITPPSDEASAVVPRAALLQARAQFEYLAKESLRRNDVSSQAMCELGVHAIDQALNGKIVSADPAGTELAFSILTSSA